MSLLPSQDSPAPAPRRRRLLVLWLLALAIPVWLARAPLLRALAHVWIVDDPIRPADVALVLNGGAQHRAQAAADLYRAGRVLAVAVAEVDIGHRVIPDHPFSETDQVVLALRQGGVPLNRIRRFGSSVNSTRHEALDFRDWAATNAIRSVVVCTNPFHTRRARWIFRQALAGTGIEVRVRAVDASWQRPDTWWTQPAGREAFRRELLKSAYYWWTRP